MNIKKFNGYSQYHQRIIVSHFYNCVRSYPNEVKTLIYNLLNKLLLRSVQSLKDQVVKTFDHNTNEHSMVFLKTLLLCNNSFEVKILSSLMLRIE
jgi:hypothetical protein